MVGKKEGDKTDLLSVKKNEMERERERESKVWET